MQGYNVYVSISNNHVGQGHTEPIYVEADSREEAESNAIDEMDKHYPNSTNTVTDIDEV